MPKVTEAISNFLRAQKPKHNSPDLLDRVLRYGASLEIQVNVASDNGEPVVGKRNTYTDGVNEWFNIRVPRNADSEPEWRDYELTFPFDLHAEGIGSTGWDWRAKRSRWVGFDFDSLTGHAAGIGITDTQLEQVKQAATNLRYVEVRRSTGGNGLHIYVYFDDEGIPTSNHTEHAALARAVLGMMSSAAGFDFASQIDCCGGNMWVWHRKMSVQNQGLALVKPASQALGAEDLPANWRDHIEVVTRRRAKIRVSGLAEENQDPFELLASSRRLVPLDDKHKAIIEELGRSGFSTVWVPDYHLLQTHTKAFEKLLADPDKRQALGLKGFFKTISHGRDPGTCNCFAFPLDNGAWRVYRFSPGISEADTWEQDGEGWTTCYFNLPPDLDIAARATGAEEDEQGGYVFESATKAAEVVEALGQKVTIPDQLQDRETRLKKHKDGRIVMYIERNEGDDDRIPGWLAKRGKWTKVLKARAETKKDESGRSEYDKLARALVSPTGKRAGWAARTYSGLWVEMPKDDVKDTLIRHGAAKTEINAIVGELSWRPWTLVNLPFQSEYPGDRRWNLNAAQYRFKPVELKDDEQPRHPHWDRVLHHCFQDLDDAIRELEWAKRANITSGADYGLHWAACMFREPFQHLPYLFFYGDQNCGKSTFHEALGLLLTKGVASADRALTNNHDFNGELANAVLAYIEEKDISQAGETAYNKIKDWVNSPTVWIRKMRTDAYSQPNTLHFIQCANKREACPIFPGDTRITMIYVPPLPADNEIPKAVLMSKLEEEAPHFMRTMLDLTLPPPAGRLRLPVVETHNKQRAQELNRSPLEQFIVEQCYPIPGEKVRFAEFFERFHAWLPEEERYQWSKHKVSKSLPQDFPSGACTDNVKFIGNLALEPRPIDPTARPWIVVGGKLKQR